MLFLAHLLIQLMWAALATIPAALGAALFTLLPGASPNLKRWVCRLAVLSAVLAIAAVGVEVAPVFRHEKPTGDAELWARGAVVAALVVWGVGLAVRIVRVFKARRVVRELCACSWALPADLESKLRRLSGCPHRVVLRASDFAPTVAVVYRKHPVIVIPTRALADEDLPIAVSHELAHLENGDAGWNLLYEAVSTILWFSPPVRWLGMRLRVAQELAADATAMRRHGCEPARYGRMLMRFVDGTPMPSFFMATLGSKSDLMERLESLRPASRWRRVAGMVAAAIVLAAMIPMRSADAPSVLDRLHHSLRHTISGH